MKKLFAINILHCGAVIKPSIFFKILTKYTALLERYGMYFLGSNWFILCLSHCSDTFRIMPYCTALEQHSTVYSLAVRYTRDPFVAWLDFKRNEGSSQIKMMCFSTACRKCRLRLLSRWKASFTIFAINSECWAVTQLLQHCSINKR